MRRAIAAVLLVLLAALTACAANPENSPTEAAFPSGTVQIQGEELQITEDTQSTEEGEAEKMLQMKIDDTLVRVDWENNPSVKALAELCAKKPVVIRMSMYGGFEQVGQIGSRLPSDDVQTVTAPGDIVLYSSNQLVVFYGSNSWAYTRLGHITDRSADDLAKLLGRGEVTVTLSLEDMP